MSPTATRSPSHSSSICAYPKAGVDYAGSAYAVVLPATQCKAGCVVESEGKVEAVGRQGGMRARPELRCPVGRTFAKWKNTHTLACRHQTVEDQHRLGASRNPPAVALLGEDGAGGGGVWRQLGNLISSSRDSRGDGG